MAYITKNFDSLLGLSGFSDVLLKNHFTLYQGYVNNTNKLIETMNALVDSEKIATPEFSELKRRFGWEFNGMRLHELYFENLVKNGKESAGKSALRKKVNEDFGSFENWQKEFLATGAMRGIGWVILVYDPIIKKLFNIWINEHDEGHLAGTNPILVMDVFEHAFMLDYGLKRADYLAAFMAAIDWTVTERRFNI